MSETTDGPEISELNVLRDGVHAQLDRELEQATSADSYVAMGWHLRRAASLAQTLATADDLADGIGVGGLPIREDDRVPGAVRLLRAHAGEGVVRAEVEPDARLVLLQDAAWLAGRAAQVWPLAADAQGRLAAAGGELTPRGAAVRSALRTALALEGEGATVRASRQLGRALDAARA